jgi:uncharacterized integral membrane protein (TIGR00697 family)
MLQKLKERLGFEFDDSFRKMFIATLFVAGLVTSNVITTKLVMIGDFILPGAFLLYALLFLASDVFVEYYGRQEAQKLVVIGFFVSLISSFFIILTQYVPVAPFATDVQAAYEVLLGPNFRIVVASLTAYLVSQSWDIMVFSYFGKKTKGTKKWIRNNLSTLSSQFIDTFIFILGAFLFAVPPGVIWTMVFSQYLFKGVVALLDTPFFYLFTRNVVNKEFTE